MIESELKQNNSSYRYERKFRVDHLENFEVSNLIDLHPSVFSPLFDERFVNNIYFDTHEMESFLDNVNGNTYRYKVRVRWYGDLFGEIQRPNLEIKIKSGLVGTKLTYPLDPFEFDGSNLNIDFSALFKSSNLPEAIQIYTSNWKPSLVNRYKRVYYLSADEKFRLTLDTDLSYGPVQVPSFPVKMIDYTDSSSILELKYERENDKAAQRISGYFPFRPTKNSKYITGMNLNTF